jgi:hypothetical protein
MIQYYIIIFSLSFMFYILYLTLLSLLLSISHHIYILSVPKYVIFHTSLKSFKFVQFFATPIKLSLYILLFSIILSFLSTVFSGESF